MEIREIIGNTTATPNPCPDWAQTDATKADYIKNKPSDLDKYPVGSIYMSTLDTSPASFMGGTWERIKDVFPLAAGDAYAAGSSGGSATHHHNAGSRLRAPLGLSKEQGGIVLTESKDNTGTGVWTANTVFAGSFTDGLSHNTSYSLKIHGLTETSDNMPPYLAFYMWVRIA